MTPFIYADFNNADRNGCLRLNCNGTLEDLRRNEIQLREGLQVVLHDEELEADGETHFSADEKMWVAKIDWRMVRRRQIADVGA